MKNFSLFSVLVAIACSTSFTSCNKNEGSVPPTGKEIMIDASAYDKWVYFSFTEGKTIGSSTIVDGELTDAAWETRIDWDIAFHRHDIRTNSGVSGNGNGGMQFIAQENFSFDAVIEAPAGGYMADETIKVTYDITQMPHFVGECQNGGSTVAAGWTRRSGMPPVWTVYPRVFVLKTANEKYVKLYLKNFLNESDVTGYVTMEYVYQSDGSTNLNTGI